LPITAVDATSIRDRIRRAVSGICVQIGFRTLKTSLAEQDMLSASPHRQQAGHQACIHSQPTPQWADEVAAALRKAGLPDS
jgi:hypothetical protein